MQELFMSCCCAVCASASRTINSIAGLVVEYIVAIDVTRVRFPADALLCRIARAMCL